MLFPDPKTLFSPLTLLTLTSTLITPAQSFIYGHYNCSRLHAPIHNVYSYNTVDNKPNFLCLTSFKWCQHRESHVATHPRDECDYPPEAYPLWDDGGSGHINAVMLPLEADMEVSWTGADLRKPISIKWFSEDMELWSATIPSNTPPFTFNPTSIIHDPSKLIPAITPIEAYGLITHPDRKNSIVITQETILSVRGDERRTSQPFTIGSGLVYMFMEQQGERSRRREHAKMAGTVTIGVGLGLGVPVIVVVSVLIARHVRDSRKRMVRWPPRKSMME